jgi:hypothetical protein
MLVRGNKENRAEKNEQNSAMGLIFRGACDLIDVCELWIWVT